MSKVFWDTNLFIYLLEDYGVLSERVAEIRRQMLARNDQLCTSTLTLGEILVKRQEIGDEAEMREFVQIVTSGAVVIPFDHKAARMYARVRQDRTIKPPDAIQLACAAAVGTDLFITNDKRLARKVVPGIHFVTSLENAYF